jgi:hypothetical protein
LSNNASRLRTLLCRRSFADAVADCKALLGRFARPAAIAIANRVLLQADPAPASRRRLGTSITSFLWRIDMKLISKLLAASALFAPGIAFAASPTAFTEACCVLAVCCGLPCC